MHRIALVALVVGLSFSCASVPRAIALPGVTAERTTVAPIELGAKSKTRVLEFEVAEVDTSKVQQKGTYVKIGGFRFGNARHLQQRSFTIQRAGAAFLSVSCTSQLRPTRQGLQKVQLHTYSCASDGFNLDVDEAVASQFRGTATLGDVALQVVSTSELADGRSGFAPAGFHLVRDGRWLASFEYFRDGKAYLSPDLSPTEHDAVLSAIVSISSTGKWFQTNLDGTVGKSWGI